MRLPYSRSPCPLCGIEVYQKIKILSHQNIWKVAMTILKLNYYYSTIQRT